MIDTHWKQVITRRFFINYTLLLFDLGGVLVELTGVPRMMELTNFRFSVSELWERWLYSPVIRLYETGRMTTDEFGRAIVKEFEMDIDPSRYLEEFTAWPSEIFPGVNKMLTQLKKRFRIASLSNTNELHWKRLTKEMDFIHLFEKNFPSHETGLLKPDHDAFHNVVEETGVPPGNILFFDDNEPNVQGARDSGLDGVKIDGFNELIRYLANSGWL